MKYLTLCSLLFCLLAISFVSAEDRTSDPNDQNIGLTPTGIDSDDTWRVDLAHKDILTTEDLNIDIKIEVPPQNSDDYFDDYQDPDAYSLDDDSDVDIIKDSGLASKDHDHKADGDFGYDLIKKEITGKAHYNIDVKPEVDDANNVNSSNDDVDTSEPEKSVDSVDDDLRPDNGKISTQVSGNGYDEIEDSDDGDDADMIGDNTDSDDDAKVDLDYQQDDSGMADDDYINEPKVNEVAFNLNDNDNDYTMDGDNTDTDGDETDNFISKDYLKSRMNLANIKLNLTTVEIEDNDDDSNGDMDGVYYNKDDDDSGDDDSDSNYDIYDTKYQEEPERGGLDDSQDSSFDYDIFIDVDDSVWDSYLADDDSNANNDDDLI